MIIEGEFFSDGHLRWNLGWPTPNYAGAFLVTFLALAFAFSGSRWRWAYFAAEAGGLFLLAKTYSRGAVVAWGLAWGFGLVASRGWREPAERLVWAARVGVLAVMMLAVGFGWSRAVGKTGGPQDDRTADKRASASEVPLTEDGSVVNRLALWQGGLKMIAAAPLAGWRTGESGRAYMNWFQEPDRDEGYTTMVNSYLHVAAEHGLPALVAVLWVGVWLLLGAWQGARNESASPASRLRQMAAGASLVAWMTANVFTTLWIEPKLWMVPMVAVCVLAGYGWGASRMRSVPLIVVSLGLAILAAGSLYGAGRWQSHGQVFAFTPETNGSVLLASEGSSRAIWHAWPDQTVLGRAPGKELRRWLASRAPGTRLISHPAGPVAATEAGFPADGAMLFGRQVERLGNGFVPAVRELWLVHPSGVPPADVLGRKSMAVTVWLPEIDEGGNGPAWRRWAEKAGARVVVSTASGLDIRAIWSEVTQR